MKSLPFRPLFVTLVVPMVFNGCSGSHQSRPTATATPGPTNARYIAAEAAYLRTRSYIADFHIAIHAQNSAVFDVFHSVCAGSADGHCQAIDVFRHGMPNPVLHQQYAGVLDVTPVPDGFTVKVVSYGPQDPLCCPSLAPVIDRFTWTGKEWRRSGPIARQPGI